MSKHFYIAGIVSLLASATPALAADAPPVAPAAPAFNNVLVTNAVASPARTKDNVEFVIGPVYANAPELTVKESVPKGTIHEFTMDSEESKIYPGIAKNKPGVVP